MLEIKGDILKVNNADAICVTTNGIVLRNRRLVMGAGVALDFRYQFPALSGILGRKIQEGGNRVYAVHCIHPLSSKRMIWVCSFPTKIHYIQKSDPDLIVKSTKQLVEIADEKGWEKIVIPRPGCGKGKLDWKNQVKPLIEDILDDRFYVITK